MKQVRITIKGQVQGVFFRAFVQNEAEKLGLKGYVTNLDNGDVEAVAQGQEDKLEIFLEKCRQGPKGSTIKKVETEEQEPEEYEGFKISY